MTPRRENSNDSKESSRTGQTETTDIDKTDRSRVGSTKRKKSQGKAVLNSKNDSFNNPKADVQSPKLILQNKKQEKKSQLSLGKSKVFEK